MPFKVEKSQATSRNEIESDALLATIIGRLACLELSEFLFVYYNIAMIIIVVNKRHKCNRK